MRLLFALFLLCLSSSAFAETAFFSEMDDVPVMPGLVEMEEATIVFDKPSGRIIETLAVSPAAPSEIKAFYARTLPQLGWAVVETGTYRRDKETLKIEFDKNNQVRFILSPHTP